MLSTQHQCHQIEAGQEEAKRNKNNMSGTLNGCELKNLTKKEKRLENKKRKIKAFLEIAKINMNDRGKPILSPMEMKRRKESENPNICSKDDSQPKRMRWHSTSESPENESAVPDMDNCTQPQLGDEELAVLKMQLREKQREKMQKPLFYLTPIGHMAKVIPASYSEESGLTAPIFIQDIQQFLLYSLVGDYAPYKPRWAQIIRWPKVSHIVVLIVEGVSIKDVINHRAHLSRTIQLFDTMVETISPTQYDSCVAEELLCVPVSLQAESNLHKRNKIKCKLEAKPLQSVHKAFRVCFNIKKSQMEEKVNNISGGDKFPRTHLLLSPLQMVLENYPLPVKGYLDEKYKNYVFTKDVYGNVTPHSPLFAVDCEMCLTDKQTLELSRVSVVNENLEVVYDTLVKPRNRIINYLTKFSGITEKMLRDVTIRLEDVQQHIRNILPADAILCGQSLNGDFHALQMIHPYVIDTSVIFNISGIRSKKPSLKLLAQIFLNTQIQCYGVEGHCSVEDSDCTMKLILLKLENSIEFGDAVCGGYVPTCSDPMEQIPIDENPYLPEQPIQNATGLVSSFFNHIKEKKVSVGLIGCAEVISQYSLEEAGFQTPKNVDQYVVSGNKEVSLRLRQYAIDYKLTISHMNLRMLHESSDRQKSQMRKLDCRLSKVFKAIAPNAMFVVIFSGSLADEDGIVDNGLCMVKLKV